MNPESMSGQKKIVAKQTDVLKTFLHAVEDAVDEAKHFGGFLRFPFLPP